MAFGVQAIVESTTISLTDGAPFKLRHARGMAGPPIRRVTARGPAQHGDTDLGYRLQPREIELEVLFHATTDAILDGYRDDLVAVFKPLTATPVNLRVTRDDDEVRQIDVFTVGAIKIDLVPEERAAHLHRATIRLRAPDPTWYDPVPGTATIQGTPTATLPGGLSPTWYLAGGGIGTARVMMQGTAPAIGEAWSYTGTISDYTLAVQTSRASPGGILAFWGTDGFDYTNIDYGVISNIVGGTVNNYAYDAGIFVTGTANYYFRSGTAGIDGGGSVQWRRGTAASTDVSGMAALQIDGTARAWRSGTVGASSTPWNDAVPIYALYSPGLTTAEIALVESYMTPTHSGTLTIGTSLSLQGDMPEYPTVRITGPIVNPIIYHTYSSESLEFSGTVGAGTTRIIDLRHGYKTVLEGTVSKRGELTAVSDLGTWHLSPDYIQGINAFILAGQSTGTATKLEIVYYHRYSSY